MGRFLAEADAEGGGGNDNGGGDDAPERDPASDYYRDPPDKEPEPTDNLGLRLTDDRPPSLADQYGVSLMDDATRDQVKSWGEDRYGSLDLPGDTGRGAREPSSDGFSFSGGSAFGGGISVGISPGPPEISFTLPLGEGSLTFSTRDGERFYGLNVGPGLDVGGVELADISVGASVTPADMGKSEVHIEGRVLGIGGRLSIEADHVARILEEKLDAAARALAPDAKRYIEELGLPLP